MCVLIRCPQTYFWHEPLRNSWTTSCYGSTAASCKSSYFKNFFPVTIPDLANYFLSPFEHKILNESCKITSGRFFLNKNVTLLKGVICIWHLLSPLACTITVNNPNKYDVLYIHIILKYFFKSISVSFISLCVINITACTNLYSCAWWFFLVQDGSDSDLYEEEMQNSDGLSDLDYVRERWFFSAALVLLSLQ